MSPHHLTRFFTGFDLVDYHVSEVSKDYIHLVSHFSNSGLFHDKGHLAFFYVAAMSAMFLTSVYGVVFGGSFWVHFVCALVMGSLWVQAGWVGHDSGHYDIMRTRRASRVAQLLVVNCMSGMSIWWWKWNHNAHHIACNTVDFDPDIQLMPFLAVSSKLFMTNSSILSHFYKKRMTFDSLARFLVSYQHWTFYPIMLFLARANMFVQSWTTLLTKKNIVEANRNLEILGLAAFTIWYPFLLSYLPSFSERLMFVVVSLMVTGMQHIQLSFSHFTSMFFVGPLTGQDWIEKQVQGTLNLVCPPWMDWFYGGMQFQIEHHLFPRMPRCQLRRLVPFVKELCEKHGLTYSCETYFKANVLTYRSLRKAAYEARGSTTSLDVQPKNLVWEALNTYG
ncbi:unnamed protein product [Cuscuta epithymum]|uniref:Fatty acid desaturase domain-containing protein n=1 Tax=Cuscuta epithymum TaxID=186058 RepID=A0AAV0CLQ6_9ASTE|nr:unnamed protein product [Cuscuta epithymum]CAH9127285.1 unnamed protein product [Cuscuta epithymum]